LNSLIIVLLIISAATPDRLFSQENDRELKSFMKLFPVEFLPFSISEDELVHIETSDLEKIPPDVDHRFLNLNLSATVENFALASIEINEGKKLLFHMEESKYPLSRKVFLTVVSKEGYPESSELFAAYEDGVSESFTYAIINSNKLIHRTV